MAYKKGIETRMQILHGSKELFLKYGYTDTTYKKIGEYLDINQNLITYHFSSKGMLAKYVLIDAFEAETRIVKENSKSEYSPMLLYMIYNRIHYKILAQNPGFALFYAQAIEENLLSKPFFQIPRIKSLYTTFFDYYGIPKKYPDKYYFAMELGSEREIMLHFKPELGFDDEFIKFVASVFPKFINIPDEAIEEASIASRKIVDKLDFKNFKF